MVERVCKCEKIQEKRKVTKHRTNHKRQGLRIRKKMEMSYNGRVQKLVLRTNATRSVARSRISST
jgi:predicted secreted Zn-dependent protease